MADEITQLESARSAALAALSNDDYDTAIREALKASIIVDTIADTSKASGSALKWDRKSIDNFIARCRQLRNDVAADASTADGHSISAASFDLSEPIGREDDFSPEYWGYRG